MDHPNVQDLRQEAADQLPAGASVEDLSGIHASITRDNPSLRELVRPPYRGVDVLSADAVSILTIFHSARTFPEPFDAPPR